jgi:hypothetical protein
LGELGDAQNPSITLPDLSPNVTEVYIDYQSVELDQETGQWNTSGPMLEFDTWAQNLGKVPVELQADDPGNLAGSSVSQCVSWTTNLVCRQRQTVGGFVWHDAHVHYHFEDFASYELRALLPDGEPDFSDSGLLATSPKVSFCLEDSTKVSDDAPVAPRYTTCNPVQEGISPGWTDIYPSGIEGQTLSLDRLTDGRYALVITLNPAQHLYETNPTNNRVVATLAISHLGSLFPQAEIVQKELR